MQHNYSGMLMICIPKLKNEKIVYFMLNIIKLKFSPVYWIRLTNLLQYFLSHPRFLLYV